MATQTIQIQHRPTGLWYWMLVRPLGAFVQVFSFDGGKSWHKTRGDAFDQAMTDPQEAPDPGYAIDGLKPCDDPACPGSLWRMA